jgi:hypothetical protein
VGNAAGIAARMALMLGGNAPEALLTQFAAC